MLLAMGSGLVTEAAELKLVPYVAAEYRSESNVYRFSPELEQATGIDQTADRVQTYTVGLEATYAVSQQTLSAVVEGQHSRFDRFTDLNHDGHRIDLNYKGPVLTPLVAEVQLLSEKRLGAFEERRSTDRVMEDDLITRGSLELALTPALHLLTEVRLRQLDSPQPDAAAVTQPPPGFPQRLASPNFAVRETAYAIGLQYGINRSDQPEVEAPLLVGLMLEQQNVRFSGFTEQPVPPPPQVQQTFDPYRLLTLETTARYVVSGLSTFDAAIGVTEYSAKNDRGDSDPELTGAVGYTRTISVVTEVNVSLYRRVMLFAATADTTTDTGVGFGLKWQPLLNLDVAASALYATSDFGRQGDAAPENTARDDRLQSYAISISYPIFQVLSLRLFGSHEDRRSSFALRDYDDQTIGVALSFRLE